MHCRKTLVTGLLAAAFVAATADATTTFRATPHAALLLVPRGGAAAAPAPKKAPAKSKAAAKAPSKGLLGCGSLAFDKASVVKVHGMVGFVFTICWALETFGVPSAPIVGLQSTIKGISMDDPITKYLVRIFSSALAAVCLAEMDPSANPYMQKIFPLYHIPLALAALAGAREFAKGPFGYASVTVLGLFLVLGILA